MRLLRLLAPVTMVIGLAALAGAGLLFVLSVTRGAPPAPPPPAEHGTAWAPVENQRDMQMPPATPVQAEQNGSLVDGSAPLMASTPFHAPSQTSTSGTTAAVLLLPLALLLATVPAAVVILARARSSHRGSTGELALVQEIHDGLQRMERRIEALETLVVDDRAAKPAGRP